MSYYRPYCTSVHHRLKPWNQDDVDFIKGIIKSEKIIRVISLLIVFHQDLRGDYHVSTMRQESMIMLCFEKKVDKSMGQEITLQPRKLFFGRQSKREKLKESIFIWIFFKKNRKESSSSLSVYFSHYFHNHQFGRLTFHLKRKRAAVSVA